jgi:hypothetical protein
MKVEEAKGVCKDRNKWKEVILIVDPNDYKVSFY